ncbi:MAG: metallophosphoesterase [Planctomycetes bacterium]|nr:metallophosphoesterase [Planctomycetota bacterium]MCB9902792.1 metallophosphoesterase [Planctomycetota bacterium]
MTSLHHIDELTLAALAVAVLPALWLARPRPRLAFLWVIAACLGVPVAASFAAGIGGFAKLRLLAWGVFAGFPAGTLAVALLARRTSRALAVAGALAAVCMLGVYGFAFHLEPRRLEISRFEIVSPRIEVPLRIVLLADIQTDDVGEHERHALRIARDAGADLILLAGDYLQCSSPAQWKQQIPLFRELLKQPPLHAPLGVHAVAGNCEGQWNWTPIFEGTGVTTYEETTTVDLGPVTLTCFSFREGRLGRTTPRPDECFHIALGHYPDYAIQAPVDADLLLAGHCHGGQVRVPGFGPPITLSSVPRAWTQGMTELDGGRKLIVSRGIGMERGMAPRLRFLCRPEVVIIDVVPAGKELATAR